MYNFLSQGEFQMLRGKRTGVLRDAHDRQNKHSSMVQRSHHYEDESPADLRIWKESLFPVEFLLLHSSPVYYGLGVPRGDGSAVLTIPGFLTTDHYLTHMRSWLRLIGYSPYISGIGLNADCPNELIDEYIVAMLERAVDETGRKVHVIGYSLGGVLARSMAAQRPDAVASVITIASPFRGARAHRNILGAAASVRSHILERRGPNVSPDCFTIRCSCDFAQHLRRGVPESVHQTAIYTCDDGVVDWRYCVTGEPESDFEVPGTHIGLAVNASVYTVIAKRLAMAHSELA